MRVKAYRRHNVVPWRQDSKGEGDGVLLLLLLFCHCCFAALLRLAHPVSAAAMRSQQQWQDGCWWHDSGVAAEQQGCGCGYYGYVENP